MQEEAAESKAESFRGRRATPTPLRGSYYALLTLRTVVVKDLFSSLFFQDLFFSHGTIRQGSGYSVDGVHVPGFLIFHFYISVRG